MGSYHFFSPLSNASGSFRSVNFRAPFRVERWPKAKIVRHWRQLASLPKLEIEIQSEGFQCVPRGYRVGHVVTATVEIEDGDDDQSWRAKHKRFDELDRQLREQLRLVGLFLAAPVEAVASYWYSVESGKLQVESGMVLQTGVRSNFGPVNANNVEDLNSFIQSTHLPLRLMSPGVV